MIEFSSSNSTALSKTRKTSLFHPWSDLHILFQFLFDCTQIHWFLIFVKYWRSETFPEQIRTRNKREIRWLRSSWVAMTQKNAKIRLQKTSLIKSFQMKIVTPPQSMTPNTLWWANSISIHHRWRLVDMRILCFSTRKWIWDFLSRLFLCWSTQKSQTILNDDLNQFRNEF
jgi:hypothetical protein